MNKIYFSGLCLVMLAASLTPTITSAAYSQQDYTQIATIVNPIISNPLRPSEIVALYPMSPVEEAAIVHVAPECPVIVDGVLYEGKDISLFNGKRLHFTNDKAGNLFAFTIAVEMEEFLEKEYGNIFDLNITNATLRFENSLLCMDWWYGGAQLICSPGQQFSQLASVWDNCISSAQISDLADVTMWDYSDFGGDSYTMPAGSNYSMLTFQGWNDRASSIS
ncbi:MAG: hypothetical protein PHE15_00775 [Dehalococcoidales bacterium]|nr:hypothetical protein [Dehalococcoidales bacterium]